MKVTETNKLEFRLEKHELIDAIEQYLNNMGWVESEAKQCYIRFVNSKRDPEGTDIIYYEEKVEKLDG